MARQKLIDRRVGLGLSQQALAERMGCDIKTIVRYEQGQSTPWPGMRPRYAKALEWTLRELGEALDDNGDVSAPNGQEVIGRLSWYANLEQGASEILAFESFVVYALLQTRRYAEAVDRVGPGGTNTNYEIAKRVELRIARQAALTREPEPLVLAVILDESVLHRVAGNQDVMAEQLDHLTKVAQLPNVDLRILTLDAGVFSAPFGAFTVLTFEASRRQMTCIEDRTGFHYLDRGDVSAVHVALFDHLRQFALSPEESVDLIRRTSKEKYQ